MLSKTKKERKKGKERERKLPFSNISLLAEFIDVKRFDELNTCTPSIQVRRVWLLQYSLV